MPTTLFVLVNAVINAFRMVDHIVVMTRGGPDNATSLLLYYIYEVGFSFWDTAYAAALTMVLLVLLALVGGDPIRLARAADPLPMRRSGSSRSRCAPRRRLTHGFRPLLGRRVVERGEAPALELLRDRVERVLLAQDLGGIILGILDRAVTEPLGAASGPSSCAYCRTPPTPPCSRSAAPRCST